MVKRTIFLPSMNYPISALIYTVTGDLLLLVPICLNLAACHVLLRLLAIHYQLQLIASGVKGYSRVRVVLPTSL